MKDAGAPSRVYRLPVPEHPYYHQQRYSWKPDQWPNAMRIGRQTVSLPLSPKLTDANVERVIEAVRAIISHQPDRGLRYA